MSDFSTILGRVRTNLLEEGVRYKKAAATSDGATDGTSIISTSLAEFDDAWNNCICKVLDGNAAGLKKTVEDFTASSDTLSFTNNPFPRRILSGVAFELYEPGIWDGDDLKKYIELAANLFLRKATDLNVNYTVRETIGGLLGVCDLPANVLKFVDPIVKIGGKVAAIIPPNRAAQYDNDPYIDPVNGTPFAYFYGREDSDETVGQLIYKPSTNASCVFNYVPVAVFDTDGTWDVPNEAWDPIVSWATGLALQASERVDLGNSWINMALAVLPGEKELEKP